MDAQYSEGGAGRLRKTAHIHLLAWIIGLGRYRTSCQGVQYSPSQEHAEIRAPNMSPGMAKGSPAWPGVTQDAQVYAVT